MWSAFAYFRCNTALSASAFAFFAASLGETAYAHGLATGEALREDIAPSPAMAHGAIPVPEPPGLGVKPPESFWRDAFTVEAD